MFKKIIWSPLSKKDFISILDYLRINWNDKVVQSFIDTTDRSIELILTNPKQFPLAKKNKKVRRCILTKHNSLYFNENMESINILRIFDNRQDPRKLKF
jgi:plasmid stabilization system protein ParE